MGCNASKGAEAQVAPSEAVEGPVAATVAASPAPPTKGPVVDNNNSRAGEETSANKVTLTPVATPVEEAVVTTTEVPDESAVKRLTYDETPVCGMTRMPPEYVPEEPVARCSDDTNDDARPVSVSSAATVPEKRTAVLEPSGFDDDDDDDMPVTVLSSSARRVVVEEDDADAPASLSAEPDAAVARPLAKLGIGGTAFDDRCAALTCSSCNFAVRRFGGHKWRSAADYIFFRNYAGHSYDLERLRRHLIRSDEHAAYCCQCSWQSIADWRDLDQWGSPPLAFGGAANGALRWKKLQNAKRKAFGT